MAFLLRRFAGDMTGSWSGASPTGVWEWILNGTLVAMAAYVISFMGDVHESEYIFSSNILSTILDSAIAPHVPICNRPVKVMIIFNLFRMVEHDPYVGSDHL